MKKFIYPIVGFLLIVLIAISYVYQDEIHNNINAHQHPVEAHSGRTDRYGGHHDRKNGGYHYHHGCPAHSHANGCKYKYRSCR